MGFRITLEGTDTKVIFDIRRRIEVLNTVLMEKMTYLMTKLQNKAREKVSGRIKNSIRNPRASVEGTAIIGTLDWGGEETTVSNKGGKAYDIARILEEGAKAHVIHPLTLKGSRAHEKGAKRRFGKDTLHFYSAKLGKEVFADYVFHPGVPAAHFMRDTLAEMKGDIIEGLAQAIGAVKRN